VHGYLFIGNWFTLTRPVSLFHFVKEISAMTAIEGVDPEVILARH
jgi:hypothetical protein